MPASLGVPGTSEDAFLKSMAAVHSAGRYCKLDSQAKEARRTRTYEWPWRRGAHKCRWGFMLAGGYG